MSLFLTPNPVWPAVFICPVAWLPYFDSKDECLQSLQKRGPSCFVKRVYACDHCGGWHATTSAPDPGGATSGTTRTQKHAGDDVDGLNFA